MSPGLITSMLAFSVVFFTFLFSCARNAGGGMQKLGGDLGQKLSQFTGQESNMMVWYAAAAFNFVLLVIALTCICREERRRARLRNEEPRQGARPEREEFVRIQDVQMMDERGYTGGFAIFRNGSKYLVGL